MIIPKNTITQNKGFTLIELLVVIGIISLLSAVVLASLTQTKAQAINTKQIADYRTVLNAMLQFKQDNGYYPSYGDASGYTCIGNYSNGCKIVSPVSNSTNMNDSLKKYLSSYTFIDKPVKIITSPPIITMDDYNGFVFACTTETLNKCNSGKLLFPALKNKNSCPQVMSGIKSGDDDVTGTKDYTLCSIILN
jgi:prepilin-type N-terminal cleavage/methylation domain-containing protein